MLKQSSNGIKKALAILLAVLFVVSLTAVLSSAHHYEGGAIQTYSATDRPAQITTDEAPLAYDSGVPVFETNPHGINSGKIEIQHPANSLGTPEGSS
jgi:hypothetical protein